MIDYITKEVYEQAQGLYNEFVQFMQDKNIKDVEALENACRHVIGYVVEDTADEASRVIDSYTGVCNPDELEFIEMYFDGNDLTLYKSITLFLKDNQIMFEVTDITVPFENAEILVDDNYAY